MGAWGHGVWDGDGPQDFLMIESERLLKQLKAFVDKGDDQGALPVVVVLTKLVKLGATLDLKVIDALYQKYVKKAKFSDWEKPEERMKVAAGTWADLMSAIQREENRFRAKKDIKKRTSSLPYRGRLIPQQRTKREISKLAATYAVWTHHLSEPMKTVLFMQNKVLVAPDANMILIKGVTEKSVLDKLSKDPNVWKKVRNVRTLQTKEGVLAWAGKLKEGVQDTSKWYTVQRI